MKPPQLIRCCFTDFDELTAATQGWNLEFNKLDCSSFQGEIFQLISPELNLGRGRFSSRLKQQGAPPAGFRTFTVSASPDFRLHWRNHQIDGNHLMVFPFGGELNALSAPGFDVFTISILEENLWRRAEQLGFQSLEKQLFSTEVFRGDPAEMNELRRMLLTYYTQAVRSIFDVSAMTQRLTDKLISIMTGASTRLSGKGHASRRLLAIQQTDRRILSNPTDPPAVRDICTIAGVSERTLEYAFNDHYNMTPKAYINALRLNAVRKKLRAMNPGSIRVADAANLWGFWHMGQFAADYRKLFGENPSETLGCTAKSCRPTCTFREACDRLCV